MEFYRKFLTPQYSYLDVSLRLDILIQLKGKKDQWHFHYFIFSFDFTVIHVLIFQNLVSDVHIVLHKIII